MMIPGPTTLSREVLQEMSKQVIDHRSAEFHELFTEIEEYLKKLFKTKSEIVILTASGTGAVESAIHSLINKGEKLLIPIYGAFCERAAEIAERIGVKTVRLEVEWGKSPEIDEIKELMDENKDAKALFIVYNETSTGVTVRNLKEISSEAKKRNLLVIVDAISIVGGDYLLVDDWGIDLCIAASQKCIASPPGLSFVSISEFALREANKVKCQSLYFHLPLYVKWMKERKETPFTPAVSLLFALRRSLSQVLEEGLERRIERHRICAETLYKSMETYGLELFAEPKSRSNTVISVNYPRTLGEEFRVRLRERFGVYIAGGMGKLRGKIFRIGNMGNVNPRVISKTVLAIGYVLSELGYSINLLNVKEVLEDLFSTFNERFKSLY